MPKDPTPRMDALRVMRESMHDRAIAAQREMDRAGAALAKRKLEDLAEVASDRSVAADNRRKTKKAVRNSRRGNNA